MLSLLNGNFLWGSATSSFQVEGANNNNWTTCDADYSKKRAAIAEKEMGGFKSWPCVKGSATEPCNYVSGELADHFNRYREDFDLMQSMNMNAYRFSIEWSRVQPHENEFDDVAISWYKEYLDELISRGIEPILTLFHFTLPVWFVEKGGFEKRANIKYFVSFAKKIAKELHLGKDVKYVITINEPEVYAFKTYMGSHWPSSVKNPIKMIAVLNNLCRAHNLVADAIHQIDPDCKLSIAKQPVFLSGSDNLITRLTIKVAQYVQNDWILNKVVQKCDFLGINYYMSMKVDGFNISKSCSIGTSDLDWGICPADIQFVLERMSEKYSLPIMVTENGVADANDKIRKVWISHTIASMRRAINNGVNLLGYIHWSLIDNFEWEYGKLARFGLIEVDYNTGERRLRNSAIWFGSVINDLQIK